MERHPTRGPQACSVLVVDDDVDIREPLVELLAGEGYRVLAAANGLEALAVARRDRPDLILLDLLMPVMSGQEFRAEQAQDPSLASIPVVAISASASGADATAFLPKPFGVDELLGLVRCLSTAAAAGSPSSGPAGVCRRGSPADFERAAPEVQGM